MNMIPENDDEIYREGSILGFRAELEQILDFLSYKENPNLTDFFGTTLLHFAVTDSHDNFDVVEKLIKAGADVNAQNNSKQTPLHLAVIRHNWKVINTLIAYDARINIKEIRGNTALHFAIDLIWSRGRLNQQETRSWMVKKLLHSGADPNVCNINGETPLMIAVKSGDLGLVEDLLAFGANVNFRNKYSETCLHMLTWCPFPDVSILKELLKNGACVNCYDDIGRTALDVLLETLKVGDRRQLEKAFISTSTLVNWRHSLVFQVANQNQEKFQSLLEFMDRCRNEVSRMRSYIYSDESTLCQFALNGSKVDKNGKSEMSILEEVLNTLIKDEFPIYNDLIEAHFDKEFLKEKLFEMDIYSRRGKGKIHLHPHAVSDIAYYLSGRDILNLLRAYTKRSNDPLGNDKINAFTSR